MNLRESKKAVTKILIVEDEALLALDLEQSFKEFGYEVVGTASNSQQAIRGALQFKPDLILMDINLPGGMDGIGAYSKIREEMDVPVVYLTGYSESDVLERAKKTQPYGYLGKPVSFAELRSTVETALYKHEADKRVRESEEKLRSILDSLHDFVFVLNKDGFFTDYHLPPNHPSKLYVPPEKFIGRHYNEVLPQEVSQSLKLAIDSLEEIDISRQFDYSMEIEGQQEWFSAKISKRKDSRGRFCGITIACREITERKSAEEALLESQNMLRRSQSIAHVGSWQLELTTNRLVWSDEAYRIFGVHAQEFASTYEAFLEMVHPEDRVAVDRAYSTSLKEDRDGYEIEHRIVHKPTGEVRFVHEKYDHFRDASGRIVRSVGMVQDITDRKSAEEALKALLKEKESIEARFESFMDYSPLAAFICDTDDKLVYVNKRYEELLGKNRSEILGRHGAEFFPAHVAAKFSEQDAAVLSLDKEIEYVDVLDNSDGTPSYWHTFKFPVMDVTGRKFVGGMSLEITRQMHMEEELRKRETEYRSLIEVVNGGLAVVDENLIITYANDKLSELLGLSRDDICGRSVFHFHDEPGKERAREKIENRKRGAVLTESYETVLIGASGDPIPVIQSSSALFDNQGKFKGVLAVFTDISELKKTEQRLRQSLREKEVLLREVHHRVKNNLAVVSSLLRLPSRYVDDESCRAILSETEARIRSMALAHAQLYQTEGLSHIDARKYLAGLLANLRSSWGQLRGNVRTTSEIEPLNLQIDTAIPLGLILTELVSNAFKHAFPDGRRGKLSLSFRSLGDNGLELVVWDDGVGMPDDIDLSHPTSCGLTLVDVFVKQINGVLEVRREMGTEMRVRFPVGV